MRKLIFLLSVVLTTSTICIAQQKTNQDVTKIKNTIVGFLIWYKTNGNKLQTSPIITGYNIDTVKKGTVVGIDMKAVEEYLAKFDEHQYVSKGFLNNIRQVYKDVADTLIKFPVVDYFGPIGGLEADLIFGFEPGEILDHIQEGIFTKIRIVCNKAIVKFDVSEMNQYVFTLTKANEKWQIDYFGINDENYRNKNKAKTISGIN